jgi:osmotically-inducible protein OsmY
LVSNDRLLVRVVAELRWDPTFDYAAIIVSACDGEITLRGTVGSLSEKLEATTAANRVYGVRSVKNDLIATRLSARGRDDADLRGDVLNALVLDSLVPATIDAHVEAGLVTLSGSAESQYQRDEAVLAASNIAGALEVFDQIELKPIPRAEGSQIRDREQRVSRVRFTLRHDLERNGID